MDPRHRDRIAFFRVCSGRYTPAMKVQHQRIGREMKLGNVMTFMANERVASEDAVAGDIIGIHNHGQLQIGDTLTEGEALGFKGIPYFAPEMFRVARPRDPFKAKQLQKGLQQLGEEGAIQVFETVSSNTLLLGAVGQLQFEVVAARLASEYKVDAIYDDAGIATARWLTYPDEKTRRDFERDRAASLATDVDGNPVYLATNRFNLQVAMERWPKVGLPHHARARAAAGARVSAIASGPAMDPLERADIAAGFDLAHLPPEFFADPYPYYRALREHAPVKRMPDGSWFLTRYEDILPVYRDAKAFSSDKKKEFGPKFGPIAAPRAPHDQPRLQRSAAPHARAAGDPGRAVAAAHRGDGARAGHARRRPARRDGGQARRRSHRGLRGLDPDRGHRQPAGRAARPNAGRCAVGRSRSWARSSRCSRPSARTPATPPCARCSPISPRWWTTAARTWATRTPTC